MKKLPEIIKVGPAQFIGFVIIFGTDFNVSPSPRAYTKMRLRPSVIFIKVHVVVICNIQSALSVRFLKILFAENGVDESLVQTG